jgi:DnaK suppressor protein
MEAIVAWLGTPTKRDPGGSPGSDDYTPEARFFGLFAALRQACPTRFGGNPLAKRHTSSGSKGPRPAPKRRTSKDNGEVKQSKRRAVSAPTAKQKPTKGGNHRPAVAETPEPMPKTRLGPESLENFREMLMAKRRELVGDVDSLQNEALGNNRSSAAGDLSMMPIHMADIGTDNYEQEFTIGLIENERETLKEIDAALGRIKDGTYGVCLATRKQITIARLKAKPWARYCIDHKRSEEQARRR